ncbi:hypothetical protein PENTCL1PPCAC_29734, partial [Pristionchus entomophagus]
DMQSAQNRPISGRIEDDPVFSFTQGQINFLSAHAGTVVIDDHFYEPHNLAFLVAPTIAARLRSGKTSASDFEDLRIARQVYLEEFKHGFQRLDAYKGE